MARHFRQRKLQLIGIYTVDSPSLESSLTRTLRQLEPKRFLSYIYFNLARVIRTLDNSDLPLTRGNFRLPLGHSHFFTLDNSNQVVSRWQIKKKLCAAVPNV